MKDQEIGRAVYKATGLLNEALGVANKAGLEVRLETISAGTMESPKAIMVNITVWKRMPR